MNFFNFRVFEIIEMEENVIVKAVIIGFKSGLLNMCKIFAVIGMFNVL